MILLHIMRSIFRPDKSELSDVTLVNTSVDKNRVNFLCDFCISSSVITFADCSAGALGFYTRQNKTAATYFY